MLIPSYYYCFCLSEENHRLLVTVECSSDVSVRKLICISSTVILQLIQTRQSCYPAGRTYQWELTSCAYRLNASQSNRRLVVLTDLDWPIIVRCWLAVPQPRKRATTVQGKLQSVMNAAAPLDCSRNKYDHTMPLIRELHWLRVPERITFRLSAYEYSITVGCLHGLSQPYLDANIASHSCGLQAATAVSLHRTAIRQTMRPSSTELCLSPLHRHEILCTPTWHHHRHCQFSEGCAEDRTVCQIVWHSWTLYVGVRTDWLHHCGKLFYSCYVIRM